MIRLRADTMTAAPNTEDRLGDFTTDTRVLTLMAVFIGVISAAVTSILVSRGSGWLTSRIRLFRNKVRMRFRRAG